MPGPTKARHVVQRGERGGKSGWSSGKQRRVALKTLYPQAAVLPVFCPKGMDVNRGELRQGTRQIFHMHASAAIDVGRIFIREQQDVRLDAFSAL